jgi:hypothetical protein
MKIIIILSLVLTIYSCVNNDHGVRTRYKVTYYTGLYQQTDITDTIMYEGSCIKYYCYGDKIVCGTFTIEKY